MTREEMYALARATLESMSLPSDVRVVLVVSDLKGDNMSISGNCCQKCSETLLTVAAIAANPDLTTETVH